MRLEAAGREGGGGGGVGILGHCGSGQFLVRFFGFRTLKLLFFSFGVLPSLRVFSNLVFGFRFLSIMMVVFRFFLSRAFFSGFDKEVIPCSRA